MTSFGSEREGVVEESEVEEGEVDEVYSHGVDDFDLENENRKLFAHSIAHSPG